MAQDVLDDRFLQLLEDEVTPDLQDGIVIAATATDDETREQWEREHERADEDVDDVFLGSALGLVRSSWTPSAGAAFLELGCGPMKIGAALAAEGVDAVGLDFSLTALRAARARLRARGLPVRLVLADVRATPFRTGAFDAVYGGGVIEHVRELDVVLGELRRITSPGGVVVNTVPYLSLGALTYRQLWGNIPAVPGLRHVAELVHLRLLRGRHLRFGYERSYPAWMLRRSFREAGFTNVSIAHYDVPLVFEYLPARLRPAARRLAAHRAFWPMIVVVARTPG
jgi:SAM-dependent methyltransferase